MESISDLADKASKEGYIIAFAQSTPGYDASWNAGACCGDAVENDFDDISYFKTVIRLLTSKYKANPNEVFVGGWSNGGMMSLRMACEMSDWIRGAISFAGDFV